MEAEEGQVAPPGEKAATPVPTKGSGKGGPRNVGKRRPKAEGEKEAEERKAAETTAMLSPSQFAERYCTDVPDDHSKIPAVLQEDACAVESKISASGLGRFFHLNCHRFLSFSTAPKEHLESVIPKFNILRSAAAIDPLDEAIRMGGFEWEHRITHELLKDFDVLQPSSLGKKDEYFTHSETVELLRTARPGQYIFQASIEPPEAFYRNLDKRIIKFGVSRPDLLLIDSVPLPDGKRSLIIIDAKSSRRTKFSQQVQVAFYAMLLQTLLKVEGIEDIVMSLEAGIWLKNESNPEWFKLAPIVSLVEDFVFRSSTTPSPLERLLVTPRPQAKWQMTPLCESPSRCGYFNVCHNQAEEEQRLSQVAYMSRSDHSLLIHLRDKLVQPTQRTTDIEDIHQLLTEDKYGISSKIKRFAHSNSIHDRQDIQELIYLESDDNEVNDLILCGTVARTLPRIKAAITNKIEKCTLVSLSLPYREDIAVYITVQGNPVGRNELIAWGLLVRRSTSDSTPETESATGTTLPSLVRYLASLFLQVHQENETNPKMAKSLSCYIWDDLEKAYLFNVLMQALFHEEQRGAASPDVINFEQTLMVLMCLMNNSSMWLQFPSQIVPSGSPLSTSSSSSSSKSLLFSPWSPSPSSLCSTPATPASPYSPSNYPQVSPAYQGRVTPQTPTSPANSNEQESQPKPDEITDTPKGQGSRSTRSRSRGRGRGGISGLRDSRTPATTSTEDKADGNQARGSRLSAPPIVVIQDVIARNLAIPHLFPTYDLASCLRAICHHSASVPLSASYIYGLWQKQHGEVKNEHSEQLHSVSEEIENALKEHLNAMDSLVKALRSDFSISTNKQQSKFGIGQVLEYAHPILSRIAFIQQYEAWARCARLKEERFQLREQRLLSGKAYHLEVIDARKKPSTRATQTATYDVLCRLATFTGSLPDDGDFGNSMPWLLSHDSIEGEEALRGFEDVKYFLWDTPPYENIDVLAIARVNRFVIDGQEEVTEGDSDEDNVSTIEETQEMLKAAEAKGKNVLIKLSVKIRAKSRFFHQLGNAENAPSVTATVEGGTDQQTSANPRVHRPLRLLMQKRHTDPFTYTRVQELLYDLNACIKNQNTHPLALRLLEDPATWASPDVLDQRAPATSDKSASILLQSAEREHASSARKALFTTSATDEEQDVREESDSHGQQIEVGSSLVSDVAPASAVDEIHLEPTASPSFHLFSEAFEQAAMQAYQRFKAMRPEKLSMTSSQEALFASVLKNRLQLVWGPPGTGKTQFLALLLLCLVEAHRELASNSALNVVVTAYTHVAIENLLIRIAELQQTLYPGYEPIDLVKLGDSLKLARSEKAGVKLRRLGKGIEGEAFINKLPTRCIVGGTVWALHKAYRGLKDVISILIVDEASQVPVAEAAIPLSFVDAVQGRVVLAGDNKQLGTILAGSYPAPSDAVPPLHQSIFKCLKFSLKQKGILACHMGSLEENFRMNEELCALPQQLYGTSYRPAARNKDAKLTLQTRCTIELDRNAMLRLAHNALLDAKSLVVFRLPASIGALTGVGLEEREALLVAMLALVLWDGSDYDKPTRFNQSAFWKDKLFVVTPRHVQRIAVRKALEKAGFDMNAVFVDTVEKMQGQECDCVIVCYGAWTTEQLMANPEFAYSLNRLNVSITRARKKCILLLSDAMLEPSSTVLDDPRSKKGFFYLRQLMSHAKVIPDVP